MEINYQLKSATERRQTPFHPQHNVGFGKLRTDHMFLMDYENGQWQDPRIVPYDNIAMPPGAMVLHYGQSIFEGAKAFMHEDGEIYTFRLDKNAARMNHSAEIICMPTIPEEDQLQAINALIDVERLWFPMQEGACFYIRPFMFATEDRLSVSPSQRYTFCVIISPSGPYYGDELDAIRLLISKTYHRAVSGGTGSSKVAGNYAASLRAGEAAYAQGAAQVLYLDANNKYIEEAGAMNHFHIMKDGSIVIPQFGDTILESITSRSILELAPVLGCEVRQEKIALSDFVEAIKSGDIIEAGGFGTAAVVSPVGSYLFEDGSTITVGDGSVGPHIRRIYQVLTDIQKGVTKGPDGWVQQIGRVYTPTSN